MTENEILSLLKTTAKNLEKNNMQTVIAKNKAEAIEAVKSFLFPKATLTIGGSKTIVDTGIYDMLKKGDYIFYDRADASTQEEKEEIYRKAFSCDAYLSSSNAITKSGVLYNVDGNSNRVSAMLFGPKTLIVVAGYNKIVENMSEAVERVKKIAAPLNCERLGIDNYCALKGQCVSLNGENPDICDGCYSDRRICCSYTAMAYQRIKDRVKVILVAEELGF